MDTTVTVDGSVSESHKTDLSWESSFQPTKKGKAPQTDCKKKVESSLEKHRKFASGQDRQTENSGSEASEMTSSIVIIIIINKNNNIMSTIRERLNPEKGLTDHQRNKKSLLDRLAPDIIPFSLFEANPDISSLIDNDSNKSLEVNSKRLSIKDVFNGIL